MTYYETTNLCEMIFSHLVELGFRDDEQIRVMMRYFIDDMNITVGGAIFIKGDLRDIVINQSSTNYYIEFRNCYSTTLNSIEVEKYTNNVYRIHMFLNGEEFIISSNHCDQIHKPSVVEEKSIIEEVKERIRINNSKKKEGLHK